MKDNKSIATARDFYTMPFFAFFVLFVTVYGLLALTQQVKFSGGYDLGFFSAAAYIVASHVLALSVVPLLALRKRITKESITLFTTFGVVTILMQLSIRLLSIGASHLDCSDRCVDTIIPIGLDWQIFGITAIALTVVFISFLKVFRKKAAL